MTTAAPETESRSPGKTWISWHTASGKPTPDQAEWITREEAIERLHRDGVEVSAGDFKFWQQEGVIPYPVKHWREGRLHSLYADWIVDAIAFVRKLQRDGYRLKQIGPLVRGRIYHLLAPTQNDPYHIADQLKEFARTHERVVGGRPIIRVEVKLINDRGQAVTYADSVIDDVVTNQVPNGRE